MPGRWATAAVAARGSPPPALRASALFAHLQGFGCTGVWVYRSFADLHLQGSGRSGVSQHCICWGQGVQEFPVGVGIRECMGGLVGRLKIVDCNLLHD